MTAKAPSLGPAASGSQQRALFLGALGVVYGDIGTSPLYAVKQCFNSIGEVSGDAVLGMLSLIAWSLTVIVTVKYVIVIMRADNRGEGGILALTALALRAASRRGRRHRLILSAGLIGAALFYGDGVITPAISVLSAVEGLNVATPIFEHYVVPIAIVLLVGLFLIQQHGTEQVGRFFGPVMAVWFLVLAVLGAVEIVQQPAILRALNPLYGVSYLAHHSWRGFVVLGAVVLAVTGAEALYADMGHFGRPALRRAWFSLVFPALLINYFGQGALLLRDPSAVANPFYRLVPAWGLYPMVALASLATIIASQAVISGAFSLTRQAVQLGYLPRLEIRHTSAQEMGQIYVPFINYFLLVAVLALVLGFKSSDNLGAAYGIAVTGTMSLTTVLAYIYMHGVLRWNTFVCVLLFGFFLLVDLAFFGANLLKIVEGGWFPLVVAAAVFAVMTSWIRGRNAIVAKRTQDAMPIELFLKTLRPERMASVPGTAVFMTANVDQVPRAMLHNLKHNKVLHQNIVLMKVLTEDIPRVEPAHRLDMRDLGHNFHALTAHYGFMEEPNIPRALAQCETMGLRFNMMETSIFVGREKIVAAKVSTLSRWRRTLFIFMSNLMVNATDFFGIPINRVVELGGQIEI